MKNAWTGVAVAAALCAAAGCFRNVVSEVTLDVPQMKSAEAARIVENTLRGLNAGGSPGKTERNVRDVKTDWQTGKVTVRYNNVELGVCNLRAAVAHAGFSADEFPADEAARAKLPAAARVE